MHDMDAPRTAYRGLGLALLATPLLWLVAEAVSPRLGSDSAAQLAIIARHQDRWYWYTVLLTAGLITCVPALLGLVRLAGGRHRRLALVGGTLAGYGVLVAIGDAMSQLVFAQMVTGGADRGQMAALLDRFDNSAGAALFFAPGGLALLVGSILLGVALARGGALPTWAAIALPAGMAVNLAGFTASSIPVIVVSCLLLLAGMGAAARLLLVAPFAGPVPEPALA